jgi:hypothetical protein
VAVATVSVPPPVTLVKSGSTKSRASLVLRVSAPVPKVTVSAEVKFAVATVKVSAPVPREIVSVPVEEPTTVSSPEPVVIVTAEVVAKPPVRVRFPVNEPAEIVVISLSRAVVIVKF